jgi:hypothetical protein
MSWFARKRESSGVGSSSRGAVEQVDGSLPDAAWLSKSKNLYEQTIDGYYGTPESMAEGGQVNYGIANFRSCSLLLPEEHRHAPHQLPIHGDEESATIPG